VIELHALPRVFFAQKSSSAAKLDDHTGITAAAKVQEDDGLFYNGVDLSYVAQAEAQGFQFRASSDAEPSDPIAIVAKNGANIARLRIWNDPPYANQSYANVTNVIALAKRVHAAGMMVHLDFMCAPNTCVDLVTLPIDQQASCRRYSDWWADRESIDDRPQPSHAVA